MGKPQAPIPRRTQSWNTPTPVIAAAWAGAHRSATRSTRARKRLLRRRPATAEEVQGFRPFRTPQVGHAGLGLSLREQIVWTEELVVEAHAGEERVVEGGAVRARSGCHCHVPLSRLE